MPFPDIRSYPRSNIGPYEENMGKVIVRLLKLFRDRVVDKESAAHVLELAEDPEHWSAAHAVFDEVRRRLLAAGEKAIKRSAQYGFEELCCKALYNATKPNGPFDSSSPFFVATAAIDLAQAIGISTDAVVAVLAPQRPGSY